MQRGFATLEIILVTIIIAVLVKVAVPNAARILDTAALDYETKKFYSELRFVEEINRSSRILSTGTGETNLLVTADGVIGSDKIILHINPSENNYRVSRTDKDGNIKKYLREPHYFSYGVTIFFGKKVKDKIISNFYVKENKITANEEGKMTDIDYKTLDGTITLTSQLGKNRYIIFDTVGRIKTSDKPPSS